MLILSISEDWESALLCRNQSNDKKFLKKKNQNLFFSAEMQLLECRRQTIFLYR